MLLKRGTLPKQLAQPLLLDLQAVAVYLHRHGVACALSPEQHQTAPMAERAGLNGPFLHPRKLSGIETSFRAVSQKHNLSGNWMARQTRSEQLAEAERRGRKWLDRLRRLEERGVTAGPLYEEAEQKSQFWLDKYNLLHAGN